MAIPETLQHAILENDLEAISTGLAEDQLADKSAALRDCLALAMSHGALSATGYLFRLGAELTSRAIWSAIDKENTNILQTLLDAGWDIDSTTEFGLAAIHYSVGSETVLRWLLEHGANPNVMSERRPGRECHTPLAEAAENPTSTAVKILLEHGAEDPEAILYAVGVDGRNDCITTLEALIDAGVDVNYNSESGARPCIRRSGVWIKEKVKLLLAHGADPHIKRARCGFSALDLAKKKGVSYYVAMMEGASGAVGP